MDNDFMKDCYLFINIMKKKYTFNSRDILLWIYLNMYIYKQQSLIEGVYNKQQFIKYIKIDRNFYSYCRKYEDIQESDYIELYRNILKKYEERDYIFNQLHNMEEIYEIIIQKNLRLKTGSYYTPKPIVEYMVFESIIFYIDNKLNSKSEKLRDYMLNKTNTLSIEYILGAIKLLEELKIIDIACGGGIFLRECLKFLFTLHRDLYKLIGKKVKEEDLIRSILENNIYGVDIQQETTILCKLLLLIEAKNLCRSFTFNKELNIFNEDALKMDFEKTIGYQNFFDIVLGNPPYIGEKGNKELFDSIRQKDFGKKYYERKMDYFYFFIYKAYEILKQQGVLCYITTNYFITADGAKKLRGFIKTNFIFRKAINFNTLNIFQKAKGQHNIIFLMEKGIIEAPVYIINFLTDKININDIFEVLTQQKNMSGIEIHKIPNNRLYDHKGYISIQSFNKEESILQKIKKKSNYLLEDLCYVNQGIVSGADKVAASWAHKLGMQESVGKGIFVLKEEELKTLNIEEYYKSIYVKEFYKNSHIKKYHTLEHQGLYILYINDDNLQDLQQIPSLYKHLSRYKSILEQRREVKQGVRKWYALQWPRRVEIFEGAKIVVPQRGIENTFAYIEGPWYASADVYYITPKTKKVSLYYLLGLLNSSLIYYWLFYRGKRKGEYLELYATPLKGIPIYYSPTSEKGEVIESLVRHIIQNPWDKGLVLEVQNKIDELVFGLYGLTESEEKSIKDFVKSRKRQ